MKHTLTLLLLAATLSSQAQFGIKAGVNASRFRAGYEHENKPKVSPTGGVYVAIPLSPAVTLQPELLYTSKGTKINGDGTGLETGRFRMNLNYAEMPVVLRIGAGQFKLEAGGYAAYLVKMDISKWNYGSSTTSFDENDFQRYDFGAVGGIAYRWDWITFSARYKHGLKTVGYPGQPLGWYAANRAYRNQDFSLMMEVPL